MLLGVSRVHESMPLFLIDGVKRRLGGSLRERKVAVLGLAFKRDTDDERDALSHKLIRLLERELADVVVHDPLVATPTASFDEAVSGAEVVIVATNHSAFDGALPTIGRDCLVVDPWNALGAAQVFAYANEIAALQSSS
jgi:UDP-N-acetyl-D-mannosaminuronic acid dehydrogenase